MTELTGTEESYRSVWSELRHVPFRQGWIDVSGVKTRYVEAGDPQSPAIVMLHGTGGHWESYCRNIGVFAEAFHCVAFDMLGHGYTSKPDIDYEIPLYADHVTSLMNELGIEHATLIGVSLGAWIAGAIAARHPDLVDKLILLTPTGLFPVDQRDAARVLRQRTEAVNNPTWESIKVVFDHLLAQEENRIPDMIALRQDIYRQDDTRATVGHVLALQDAEIRNRNLVNADEWASIKVPTLVVATGSDPNEQHYLTARKVAELIPVVRLVEMPHVGHWPHFENDVEFNDLALKFLKS